MSEANPTTLQAISLTEDWRSAFADPLVARWNFAGEIAHDPLTYATLQFGPSTHRFRESGKAHVRLQQVEEHAPAGTIVAAYLIESPALEEPDVPLSPKIVGIAIATPDIVLERPVGHVRRSWQAIPTNAPVTRIEVCVPSSDDRFTKVHTLLSRVVSDACAQFPDQVQATVLPHDPKSSYQKDFCQFMAGVGTQLPFFLGRGHFGWADRHPRFVPESQVLASSHDLFVSTTQGIE